MADRGPDKDRVIDALVLAFSHSELAGVVGDEALRSVLRVEYHDMVQGERFDMELLWELLEDQPGFDPDKAAPPLCLFKSWEGKLELQVAMPQQLAGLSDRERAMAASECRVPPSELRLLFRLQTGESAGDASTTGPTRKLQRANNSGAHEPVGKRAPKGKKDKPPWLGWAAAIVAVLGFGFAGYTGYTACNQGDPDWNEFRAADLELPVTRVSKLGNQLRAEVRTDAWAALEPAARKKRLETALLKVEDRGIRVIALTRGDDVKATVQKNRAGKLFVWLAPEP